MSHACWLDAFIVQRWFNVGLHAVYNAGPTSIHNWVSAPCLLVIYNDFKFRLGWIINSIRGRVYIVLKTVQRCEWIIQYTNCVLFEITFRFNTFQAILCHKHLKPLS